MESTTSSARVCRNCGASEPSGLYCDRDCRIAYHNKRKISGPYLPADRSDSERTRAVVRLRVVVDLLIKGAEVLDPLASPARILVYYNGRRIKISARLGPQGAAKKKPGESYDVLALAYADRYEIEYRPPVEQWLSN